MISRHDRWYRTVPGVKAFPFAGYDFRARIDRRQLLPDELRYDPFATLQVQRLVCLQLLSFPLLEHLTILAEKSGHHKYLQNSENYILLYCTYGLSVRVILTCTPSGGSIRDYFMYSSMMIPGSYNDL